MMQFKIYYWLGVFLQIVIRYPWQMASQKAARSEQRVSATERILLALLAVAGLLFPILYTLTHWLDFANYSLPYVVGWSGAFFLACALFVFARAHQDLRANWSPSLEIYAGHSLVTNGIYRNIRHPMYASQFLFAIAQLLLLQNWLAGPPSLLVFILFYLLRVKEEEKLMLDTFGEQYREYMSHTGGIFPKLKPR